MTFTPVAKATVLIPTPNAGQPDMRHLFIVLNNAMAGLKAEIHDGVIVTGISTAHQNGRYDNTCMLYAGDHPFIRHPSYINYSNCAVRSAQSLIDGVNEGLLIPRDPMPNDVFARVLYGVARSPRTPREIKTVFSLVYPDI